MKDVREEFEVDGVRFLVHNYYGYSLTDTCTVCKWSDYWEQFFEVYPFCTFKLPKTDAWIMRKAKELAKLSMFDNQTLWNMYRMTNRFDAIKHLDDEEYKSMIIDKMKANIETGYRTREEICNCGNMI